MGSFGPLGLSEGGGAAPPLAPFYRLRHYQIFMEILVTLAALASFPLAAFASLGGIGLNGV